MPRFKQDELGRILNHEPTDELRDQVKDLASGRATLNSIAHRIGITPKTLRKYYRTEVDEGRAVLYDEIEGKAYELALEGNPRMIEFILKFKAGWVDPTATKTQVNVLVNGQAPQIAATKPTFAMTPHALAALSSEDDKDRGEFGEFSDDEIEDTD